MSKNSGPASNGSSVNAASPASSPVPQTSDSVGSFGRAGVSSLVSFLSSAGRALADRARDYAAANGDSLKWRIPVAILIVYLLKRRIDRTRARLYAERSTAFWNASFEPPHPPPSDHLPHPLHPTHLIYSLLPVSAQNYLRDIGAFRVSADVGVLLGGALAFGWQPRMMRRMFGKRDGRINDIPYGPSPRHTLDIMAVHRENIKAQEKKSLSPVLVFMHGGAWGSGSKSFYRLLCHQFDEQLGFIVIVPNYHVWPSGSTDDQVSDLGRAVEWATRHVSAYGGDPQRIILMGHSSGAHCSSLYVLKQLAEYEKKEQAGGVTNLPTPLLPIKGVIGLAGPYDIAEHYEFEAARGVHETVPYSSSIRFAYALAGGYQRGARPIPIQKLPSHKVYHKEDNNGDEHTDIDRSFTFPRAISSDPLIHVRIVGGASDPLQCDHASFILDIMRTRSNRIKDDDASREVSTVGHTRWVMEAIQAFMAEAEQREKMNPAQTTTQTETTPTPNPNITARL